MKRLLVIGSITHTMRAKEVLASYSIASVVRRVSNDMNSEGCRHGLAVKANQVSRAAEILRLTGIRVTAIEETAP